LHYYQVIICEESLRLKKAIITIRHSRLRFDTSSSIVVYFLLACFFTVSF